MSESDTAVQEFDILCTIEEGARRGTDMISREQEVIFSTLKKILKVKKIPYRQLGRELGLSEPALKMIFSKKNTSLARIVQIAEAAGISFSDLVAVATKSDGGDFSFTPEQEVFFVENPGYYSFFREIFFEKKSVREVGVAFNLSDRSVRKYLRELEKAGVLEVLPENRLKFKVYGRLKWRRDGAWMRKYFPLYSERITRLVFENLQSDEYFTTFGYFTLPADKVAQFKKDLAKVERKYKELAFQLSLVQSAKTLVPVSWILNVVPADIVTQERGIPELPP